MRTLSLLSLFSSTAFAGSITAPGVIGGLESGAATSNPAATHYNPGALGAAEGVDIMFDLQAAFAHAEVTTTRNDGIDPNTGEPYALAVADAVVPVFFLGGTWKVNDQFALGIGATDSWVGGGDYSASEPTENGPFVGHQRYAGVKTTILTLAVTPAASFTVTDGVHIGAGYSFVYDMIDAVQSSDPLGLESTAMDSVLSLSASGSHNTWNAGVLIDRFDGFSLGLSYAAPGTFDTEGTAAVSVPAALSTNPGDNPDGLTVDDALSTVQLDLPAVIRAGLNIEATETLTIGFGYELQKWGDCCSGPDGDIAIGLTSADGDAVGPDDGVILSIGTEQMSPRRLQNSSNYILTAQYQASDDLSVVARGMYNTNAVQDFAVSATNLDFTSYGGGLSANYQVNDTLGLSLAYTRFIPLERVITNSAWDVRDDTSADYIDDSFSPKSPYKAGTNGTYNAVNNVVGIRISASL
jgi:long-subunit fatty acid transport protein